MCLFFLKKLINAFEAPTSKMQVMFVLLKKERSLQKEKEKGKSR